MKRLQVVLLLLLFSVCLYSQGTREGVLVVADKNETFGVAMNSGAIVFEADSNLMYELTAAFSYTADMDDVFTSGDYDVIGNTIWKSYGTYIYPPSAPTYVDIPYIIRHHGYQNSQIEFVEGDILIRATEEAMIGCLNNSNLHFYKDSDSASIEISSSQYLNVTFKSRSTHFYQELYAHNLPNGSASDSVLVIDASNKIKAISTDRWDFGSGGAELDDGYGINNFTYNGDDAATVSADTNTLYGDVRTWIYDQDWSSASGTVTEVTSATTSQLTVANGTTTPALTIVTAAVSDGETGLPTGDHVRDYVVGLGYMDDVVDDTSPQLGGYLDLNDKGYTLELTAGETLSAGQLCYFKNSDQEMYLADADAESTCGNLLGLCLESLTDGNSGTFLIEGIYTDSELSVGIQYVSTSSGHTTGTAPSASGDIVRIVGYNISTTKFMFKPDETYVEIE